MANEGERASNKEVSLQSLLTEVAVREPIAPSIWDDREAEGRATILQAHASGLSGLYKLREKWSGYLIKLLVVTTLFQIALIAGVGLNWLKFDGHEVFLNTVAGELFLQIAGMGYVVVKCLFPSNAIPDTEAKGNKPDDKK